MQDKNTKLAVECYQLLNKQLLNKKKLRAMKMTQKSMKKCIIDGDWKQRCLLLLSGDHVSCLDVANACAYFDPTGMCPSGKELLQYVYNYTLSQLFPKNFMSISNPAFEPIRIFYCNILRVFLQLEQKYMPFRYDRHFEAFSANESSDLTIRAEYQRFLDVSDELYLFEFYRIASECTPFDTVGHIASVHYIATSIAKQLREANVPIDLPLVSAAAITHDIGKFGCRQSEARRVPYLHYYYTLLCTQGFDLPTIGHIAANHSTWDLELENLSVENLILIYADFRAKSSRNENGIECSNLYSLDESFHVILDKLDNVDDAKAKRYRVVYDKLKDFENYITSLGVDCTLVNKTLHPLPVKDNNLLSPNESVEKLKHIAIEHNIYIMHRLNNEATLGNVLESARSEKDWKNLRTYINIFDEYCTYMTKKQKQLTLHFLVELLTHREGDIRRAAANLIGEIIVNYDQQYSKELPADVILPVDQDNALALWDTIITTILIPDHKMTDRHKSWSGYTLKRIFEAIISQCDAESKLRYTNVLLSHFDRTDYDDWSVFVLVDTAMGLPFELFTEEKVKKLMAFVVDFARGKSDEVQMSALRLCDDLVTEMNYGELILPEGKRLLEQLDFQSKSVSIDYMIYKTKVDLHLIPDTYEDLEQRFFYNDALTSDIFLENLKSATPWIFKAIHIHMLRDQVLCGNHDKVLHIATHLTNLVKVSERVTVRKRAGSTLLKIMPYLTLDQRNEIAVELLRGLEIGDYQFSKYIPDYLGEILLYLHPNEFDEIIVEFSKYLSSINNKIVNVSLATIAITIREYPVYEERFNEPKAIYKKRYQKLLGLLAIGLANYKEDISLEALYVISHEIFGNPNVAMNRKLECFIFMYKKTITLIERQSNKELSLFSRAAALNHIYRFISAYLFANGSMNLPVNSKIAFFPGTFDPFSLGHKGMVTQIRNLGFEVYLALDEFSWSKKTQPRLIRRQIMTMSVADEADVYLFPDNIPVNLANPSDLYNLEQLFPNKELYIVTGSDVIANASAYKAPPVPHSIHHMNHMVFSRSGESKDPTDYSVIDGKITHLSLTSELEDVSSTRIRNNIDLNRDISNLIDSVAQNYIYEYGFYTREPQYKQTLDLDAIEFRTIKDTNEGHQLLVVDRKNPSISYASLYYHETYNADLYHEFHAPDTINYIRQNSSGRMMVITHLEYSRKSPLLNLEQILLTEVLSIFLKEEYSYVLCHFTNTKEISMSIMKPLFTRHGFEDVPTTEEDTYISLVDMRYPLVVVRDVENLIKAPLGKNTRIRGVIHDGNCKLQLALTKLYPGNLVLSFSSILMQQRLLELITQQNGVSLEPSPTHTLGPNMCVPFGSILRDTIVPNTVTKALHTSKVIEPDVSITEIASAPNYSPIASQVKTIKAFNRPVILVDDTMHDGLRMSALSPLFKAEGIPISKILVGIVSGLGMDTMTREGQHCDSVYYLPNLRNCFTVSSLYPFIGGASIRRDQTNALGITPAINMILPYVASPFFDNAPKGSLFDVSWVCLQNAKQICKILEDEYQGEFERNLTLGRLNEVMIDPCYPDIGKHVQYDLNQAPSTFIDNSIEQLIRTKKLTL